MAARILVVDDEPDMLALMRMIIEEKSDHEVLVTNNPLEVGEILAREKVDMVITDLKMPGMDGIELLGEIKRRDEDMVVMVITAYGSLESAEEAMARGAFDFITKPFRKEQILLAVDKALRWKDMLRQNQELRRQLESRGGASGAPGQKTTKG
jgi:DNA-binding NtrC family response regulator